MHNPWYNEYSSTTIYDPQQALCQEAERRYEADLRMARVRAMEQNLYSPNVPAQYQTGPQHPGFNPSQVLLYGIIGAIIAVLIWTFVCVLFRVGLYSCRALLAGARALHRVAST